MKRSDGEIEIGGEWYTLHVWDEEREAETAFDLFFKGVAGAFITCAGGCYNAIAVPLKK